MTSSPSSETSSPQTEVAPVVEAEGTTESKLSDRYMAKPTDSYTKLAMRNMVRRGGTSLFHFALTTLAVLGTLVGLSVAFH
ncbi:MAG: DUF3285 domain-containing protein [Cyanobacteria bacterium J06639_1]